MEILSDILKSLRVSGSVYFCSQVEAPWTKEFNGSSNAGFHMVRRGHCWATVGDRTELLGPGDLIFIGPGIDHVLTSEQPIGESAATSDSTLLLCGYCSFDDDTLTPLKSIFPQRTIVREEELHQHPWLKSTFDQLSAEYMAQNPGTELIVNKLTEVVLIELIRINFGRQEKNSFLMALDDKRISKALELIHRSPEESWTIERLASQVGMSRAAFAKQFKDLVGETMFAYLSQLRIQRAKEMLRNTKLPVDDIALKIGYESERAFTKTFGKYVGMTPKQYRKQ
ncbi:TPA: AraC family transcriptional regulator [Vibrio vulnificus]|nr:AraC family transcriptional regulator [Vibrio vulnificus]